MTAGARRATTPRSPPNVHSGEPVQSAQLPQAEPVNPSLKTMPTIIFIIMAKRPFAISAANLDCFAAASHGVSPFQPESPAAAAVPADWSRDRPLNAP